MKIAIEKGPKRAVIVDNHPIFRQGVSWVINRDSRFCVVGEAGTRREGFEIIQKLEPDLAVIELWLRDENAIQFIRDIKRSFSKMHVIVLTMHREIKYILQAFGAGATGFLLKETDPASFLKGCEIVLSGEYYIDHSLGTESILRIKAAIETDGTDRSIVHEYLTAREEEVLRLVAEGVPRKEIANILCISPKTVENHITRIMKRLSLRNTIELLRWAAGLGLINLDGRTGTLSYGRSMACN